MITETLNSMTGKYDSLLKSCEGIPEYIRKRMRAKYIDKNLPFIINHVTEIEKQEYIIRLRTLSPSNSFGDVEHPKIFVQASL